MLRPDVGAKETRAAARERFRILRVDKGLAVTFLLLLASGLVVLYAASFYNAQDSGNPLSEVYSQLLGIAVGFAGMAVILQIDYRILSQARICLPLLGISFLLLILVAIPGVGKMLNGSRRWLRFGPVSFQPSELAKYAAILYLARALSMRSRDVTRFFTGLVPLFIIPGIMFLLILLQPNLSTAGSILIVSAVMVMIAGARWLHLGLVGAAGMALGRYIYFADAAVDYRRDKRQGKYNPYLAMGMEEDWNRWEEYLVLAMAKCTDAYERLPLVQDKALLDNILYSGVWVHYRGKKREETGG